MTDEGQTNRRYWGSAELSFRRAVAEQRAEAAVQTLELIGRAVLDTSADKDPNIAPHFVELLSSHPDIVRGAAAVLGSLSEMYGAEMLPKVLYARSGYQALLDAGIWSDPPLDQASLDETDEEIQELVDSTIFPPDEVPPNVPSGHKWWPKPSARK